MFSIKLDQVTTLKICVVITRNGDTGIFQIYIKALGGYTGDHTFYPADHLISIGIRPNHNWGHREYTTIYFWVWDRTTNEFWGKTYNLPETELIYKVDGALEHNRTSAPNSDWKSFIHFPRSTRIYETIDLEAIFKWKEWSCPNNMNNEHTEWYYDDYGPNTVANLWQRKTPR